MTKLHGSSLVLHITNGDVTGQHVSSKFEMSHFIHGNATYHEADTPPPPILKIAIKRNTHKEKREENKHQHYLFIICEGGPIYPTIIYQMGLRR